MTREGFSKMLSMVKRQVFAAIAAFGAAAGLATGARAQAPDPLPIRPNINGHGVNLKTLGYSIQWPALTIGQLGHGGLAYYQTYIYQPTSAGGGGSGGWRPNTLGTVTTSSRDGAPVLVVSLNGATDTFPGSLSAGVTTDSLDGTGATLVSNPSGNQYTLIDRNGVRYDFDTTINGVVASTLSYLQATLVKATTPAGEITNYNYKKPSNQLYSSYRLQSITNNFGYQIHFDYASDVVINGQSPDLFLEADKVTAFNMAVDYCDPLANSCVFSKQWPTVSYGYAIPYLSGFIRDSRYPSSVTDPLGRKSTVTYDDNLVILTARFRDSPVDNLSYTFFSSNEDGRIVQSSTKAGVTWQYGHVDDGVTNTVTVTYPDSAQEVSKFDDARSLLTSAQDALGHVTSFLYDQNRRITRVTAPEGNYVEATYDPRGNITSVTNAPKPNQSVSPLVTSATYPSAAACQSSRASCNKPLTMTNARGYVTSYTYDPVHGGLLTTTAPAPAAGAAQPGMHITYVQYRANYKNSASTFAVGSPIYMMNTAYGCYQTTASSCNQASDELVTQFVYQSQALPSNLALVSTKQYAATDGPDSSIETDFGYSDVGDTAYQTIPGTSDQIHYFYNAARELIAEIGPDPDGPAGPKTPTATRYTYNGQGGIMLTETGTTPGQQASDLASFTPLAASAVIYDAYGRPVQQRVNDPANASAGAISLLQFNYDSSGRQKCSAIRMNPQTYSSLPDACAQSSAGAYGADRITQTTFDLVSNPVKITSAIGTALVQDYETMAYTPNGKLASVKDAKNQVTKYEYDGLDRLIRTYYPDKNTAGVASTTDYVETTYGSGSRAGLVASLRQRDGSIYAYIYDNLGRAIFADAPGVTPDVSRAYDNFGRLTSLTRAGQTTRYSYDIFSRTASVTGPLGTVGYAYDLAGRRTQMTYPDGYYLTYAYDAVGRPTRISELGSFTVASYDYDALGRRSTVTRGDGGTTQYGFDSASNLTRLSLNIEGAATTNDVTFNLSYNPSSQIVSQNLSNGSYDSTAGPAFNDAYAANNLNQYSSAGGATYSYDGRGNLVSDGARTYNYDGDNNLTSVASGGVNTTLDYGPDGALYRVTSGTTATRFLYDGADLIAEYDGNGALLRRYVHGPGSDEPVMWIEGAYTPGQPIANRRFLAADLRGSVIAVTNASGALLQRNAFDSFGTPATGALGRFLFTGQAWLPEIGLYHFKARAYNPALGRFMQTDPIGFAGGLNIYNYAANDPINAVDPTGLAVVSAGQGPTVEVIGYDADTTYLMFLSEQMYPPGSDCGRTDQVDCSYLNQSSDELVVSAQRQDPNEILVVGRRPGYDGSEDWKVFLPFLPQKTQTISSKMNEDERDRAAEEDYAVCRSLSSAAARARCWASAAERDGARAAGRPVPPLVTSRTLAPVPPSPRPSAPNPWVTGGVIVGGAAVVCAVVEPCGAAALGVLGLGGLGLLGSQ